MLKAFKIIGFSAFPRVRGIIIAGLLFSYPVIANAVVFSTSTIPGIPSPAGHESAAFDRDGNLHLALRANGLLYYAKRTPAGVWSSENLGGNPFSVSLAIDGNNQPAILCLDGFSLVYKTTNGSSWESSTIRSGNFNNISLRFGGDGLPRAAYYSGTGSTLQYSSMTGTSWSHSTVDSSGDAASPIVLSLDSQQNPHILYRDDTNNVLKYASHTVAGWTIGDVAGSDEPAYMDAAVDGAGRLHAVYLGFSGTFFHDSFDGLSWSHVNTGLGTAYTPSLVISGNGELAFAATQPDTGHYDVIFSSGTGASWFTSSLDAVTNFPFLALNLDGNGVPHIVYEDSVNTQLKFATTTASVSPALGGSVKGRIQAPSNISGVAMGVSSITWTWTDNASIELGYRLYVASQSSSNYELLASTTELPADSNEFIQVGLTANTSYHAFVQAANDGGFVSSNLALRVTLAEPPLNTAVTSVTQDTADINWDANNNPEPGTYYQVVFSTSSSFAFASTTTVDTSSAGFANLLPATTYYFKVRAFNSQLVMTDFDATVTTETIASTDLIPPGKITDLQELAWNGTANEIRLSWTNPGDDGSTGILPGGSEFRIQYSTDLAGVVWSTSNAQISISTVSLSPGTTSFFSFTIPITRRTAALRIWTKDETDHFSVVSDTITVAGVPFSEEIIHHTITGTSKLFVDSNGNLHAVFSDTGGIFYIKRNGGVWSSPVKVDSNSTIAYLTVDADAHPHIAYAETTGADLKYATSSDGIAWSTTTVDTVGIAGGFSSIVVGVDGYPRISYGAIEGFDFKLKFAVFNGSSWDIELVNESSNNDFPGYNTLIMDAASRPHIFCAPGFHYWQDSSGWHSQTINDLYDHPSFAVDGNGLMHATSYANFLSLGFLVYTTGATGSFSMNLDPFGGGGSSEGLGAHSTILLDGNGYPHIAYLNQSTQQAKYATYDGTSWINGIVNVKNQVVLQEPGFTLDGSGDPHFLYNASLQLSLRHSTWNGENASLPLGGTHGRLQEPDDLEATILSNTSVRYDWDDNASNEWGYELYGATSPSGPYSMIASTDTLGADAATYTETGLTAGASYYRYIVARNPGGIAFSKQVCAYLAQAGTVTDFAGTALGVSSISWTWSDVSGETGYRVISSTGGNMSGDLASGSTVWIETGLSTNTAYDRRVVSFNLVDISSSTLISRFTLANSPSPAAPSLISIDASSATLAWQVNTNPVSLTTYTVVASTSSGSPNGALDDVTLSTQPSGVSPSALVAGLTGNTSTHFFVRAVNGDGLGTPYTLLSSTCTHPAAPASISPSGVSASSITFQWTTAQNAADSSYEAFLSTDGFLTVSASTQIISGSWTPAGLAARTTYEARVRTLGRTGLVSPYVALPSTRTLLISPGLASPSFSLVSRSSLTVHWTTGGNGGTVVYIVDISTFSNFSFLFASSSTASTSAWFGTGGHGANLSAGTTYYARVRAEDGGDSSAEVVLGSTVTAPPLETVSQVGPGGGTLELTTDLGTVSVVIPPGAFSNTVTLTISMPTTYPSPVSRIATFQGTGLGLEIELDQNVQPAQGVTLIYEYSPTDIQSQSINEGSLVLARYDENSGAWVPLQTVVDQASHRATAATHHFSLFQLMSPAAATNVDSLVIYPNPLRPSLGHTAITFANAPPNAKLRIYSRLGELLATRTVDGAGLATWDGRNDSGEKVATGLYYAVIEGTGGKKTYRVAVQR